MIGQAELGLGRVRGEGMHFDTIAHSSSCYPSAHMFWARTS